MSEFQINQTFFKEGLQNYIIKNSEKSQLKYRNRAVKLNELNLYDKSTVTNNYRKGGEGILTIIPTHF